MFATGGNRGIGLASARAFTELGDRVAVTCHSSEPPQTLTDAGCLAIRCDITDPNHVESAYQQIEERHGPVEVLVANAGITWDTLLTRMSEEDLSTVLDAILTPPAARSLNRRPAPPITSAMCATSNRSSTLSTPRWNAMAPCASWSPTPGRIARPLVGHGPRRPAGGHHLAVVGVGVHGGDEEGMGAALGRSPGEGRGVGGLGCSRSGHDERRGTEPGDTDERTTAKRGAGSPLPVGRAGTAGHGSLRVLTALSGTCAHSAGALGVGQRP
ncbi:SDR family NAD(P)-dependent oxidoreductase [Streptomyces sp. NPDC087425]|uniref:SDR family NAD(P)-dependent oxidoreductase n=1 Tax=unclassified Streptomyces TaxID=2593676 RepID=UPI00382396BF